MSRDLNTTSIVLGISNGTTYGSKTRYVEFGKNLGFGFDVLIKDYLICKSFGIKEVNIFSSSNENGVFNSYGDDFLYRVSIQILKSSMFTLAPYLITS
jgi:hypothetical protein